MRAKRKIGATGIPLRIPEGAERAQRLDIVLTVVSVMYSEAHLVAGGDAAADRDLADDAIWLARVVAHELPREAEAHGLLALLLFHRAREGARAVEGELVLLAEQDRTRWDRALIAEAHAVLERAAMLRRPGRWQLHAAIAACHADAPDGEATDWLQVLTLYDMLLAYDRSPIVRLNRAVALAEIDGPRAALDEVDALRDDLAAYHLWHAVRARMLARARARRRGAWRRISAPSNSPPTRPSGGCWRRGPDADPRRGAPAQASTGESAAETSRSSVVIPSRDRIDSRCPCTEANPGPRSAYTSPVNGSAATSASPTTRRSRPGRAR